MDSRPADAPSEPVREAGTEERVQRLRDACEQQRKHTEENFYLPEMTVGIADVESLLAERDRMERALTVEWMVADAAQKNESPDGQAYYFEQGRKQAVIDIRAAMRRSGTYE